MAKVKEVESVEAEALVKVCTNCDNSGKDCSVCGKYEVV